MTSQRTCTVYCLLTTLICTVTALKCTKLVTIDGTPVMNEQMFTEGLYAVNTTLPTNSTEIRELAASLQQDSNDMEFVEESFMATLQPKDIKKVTYMVCCRLSMLLLTIFQCESCVLFTHSYVAVSLWCLSNSCIE